MEMGHVTMDMCPCVCMHSDQEYTGSSERVQWTAFLYGYLRLFVLAVNVTVVLRTLYAT